MRRTSSANLRHKTEARVTVRLVGETSFDAVVYLALGHRLLDLLNDDRAFIPARREDGQTVILAKSQIVSILDHDEDDVEETDAEKETEEPVARKFDPYAMLRVAPDASVDDIRAAYKKRIKAVHPDSVAALGLDDELAQASLKLSQKINYAYRKIMRDRESAPSAE